MCLFLKMFLVPSTLERLPAICGADRRSPCQAHPCWQFIPASGSPPSHRVSAFVSCSERPVSERRHQIEVSRLHQDSRERVHNTVSAFQFSMLPKWWTSTKVWTGGETVVSYGLDELFKSCSWLNRVEIPLKQKFRGQHFIQNVGFRHSAPRLIKMCFLAQLGLLSICMSCKRCSVFCQQLKHTKESGFTSMCLLLSANLFKYKRKIVFPD